VTYDPVGYVYVTDAGKKTLQKFSQEGVFLKEWYISGITWESYAAVGPDNRVYITAPDENTVYTLTPEGSFLVYPTAAGDYQYFPYNFDHPMGVTLDNQGALFVTHAWSDEVAKYVPVPNPAFDSALPSPAPAVP
jgi:DNA-binding beta-propeller fold protein YncE